MKKKSLKFTEPPPETTIQTAIALQEFVVNAMHFMVAHPQLTLKQIQSAVAQAHQLVQEQLKTKNMEVDL